MRNRKLLTIAVPTYNRSEYLRKCLNSIISQITDFKEQIEVIVSDNASEDDTELVCKEISESSLPFFYYRNKTNLGMDGNFIQCFKRATGKYILLLSDDDLLLPCALKTLIDLIYDSDKEYGIIHLKNIEIKGDIHPSSSEICSDKHDIDIFNSSKSFLYTISHWISYISGNVVNRKYLDFRTLEENIGTCLVHVPIFLRAVNGSKYNLHVNTPIIGLRIGNSGGYNIIDTFGLFFPVMLRRYSPEIANKIIRDLLWESLPFLLYNIQNNRNDYTNDYDLSAIKTTLGRDYAIFISPVHNKTKVFALIFLSILRVLSRIRSLIHRVIIFYMKKKDL